MDFKGWWGGERGERVEPLTVRDEHSRMLLELRAVGSSRTEVIRPCFENSLSSTDFLSRFAATTARPLRAARVLGLSRLSAWWLALGIDLERGRPGCPQDNGAHERLHLDVRRELQSGRIGRDQDAFDLWRHEYNNERPHEALGMKRPAEVYGPSMRPYEGTPDLLDYGGWRPGTCIGLGMIAFDRESSGYRRQLEAGTSGSPSKPRDTWRCGLRAVAGPYRPGNQLVSRGPDPGEAATALWAIPLRSIDRRAGDLLIKRATRPEPVTLNGNSVTHVEPQVLPMF